MSKPCPIHGKAIYLDCLDCEEKYCRKPKKEKENSYVKAAKADCFPKYDNQEGEEND